MLIGWDVLGPAALLSVTSFLDEQLPSLSRSHGHIIIGAYLSGHQGTVAGDALG